MELKEFRHHAVSLSVIKLLQNYFLTHLSDEQNSTLNKKCEIAIRLLPHYEKYYAKTPETAVQALQAVLDSYDLKQLEKEISNLEVKQGKLEGSQTSRLRDEVFEYLILKEGHLPPELLQAVLTARRAMKALTTLEGRDIKETKKYQVIIFGNDRPQPEKSVGKIIEKRVYLNEDCQRAKLLRNLACVARVLFNYAEAKQTDDNNSFPEINAAYKEMARGIEQVGARLIEKSKDVFLKYKRTNIVVAIGPQKKKVAERIIIDASLQRIAQQIGVMSEKLLGEETHGFVRALLEAQMQGGGIINWTLHKDVEINPYRIDERRAGRAFSSREI